MTLSAEHIIEQMQARCEAFTKKGLDDVQSLERSRDIFSACLSSNEPVKIDVVDGPTTDSKDVLLNGVPSLLVLNYYTFPVTPVIDSLVLHKTGKLLNALDVRPLMFSGPAPTMIIWSGSGTSLAEYPVLTEFDAVNALKHWAGYVFGISINTDNMLQSINT